MNAARYLSAVPFETMVNATVKNADLWHSVSARAAVSDDAVRRAEALGGRWHLLAISADWCIDSLGVLPYIAAFAARAGNVDLRVVDRESNADLMDTHLTDGTKRAIPVIIAYDEQFEEQGWWASRPRALQHFIDTDGAALPSADLTKEKRRWYAQDRGAHAVEEVLTMLEAAARRPLAAPPAGSR